MGRVSYRRAIILGGAGFVLPYAYPFLYNWLASILGRQGSGRFAADLYGVIVEGRTRGIPVQLVAEFGMLMAPLAGILFFGSLYRETFRGGVFRRLASGVAAGLMLVAASASVWRDSLFGGAVLVGGDPGLLEAAQVVRTILDVGWALLLAVFAMKKVPFRTSATPLLARLLAIVTTLLAGTAIYGVWIGWDYLSAHHRLQGMFLFADAVQLAGWGAVIIFLAVINRESRVRRVA